MLCAFVVEAKDLETEFLPHLICVTMAVIAWRISFRNMRIVQVESTSTANLMAMGSRLKVSLLTNQKTKTKNSSKPMTQ